MDKEFWRELREINYELPGDYSLPELTEELFSYIGSLDPELRDSIAYETFANWLEKDQYTPEQLSGYVTRLILNMHEGLGERDTDGVFLRSFSALFLAEIVHNDNKRGLLEKDTVLNILNKGLSYFAEEKDRRGYVPEKGWAHALAHTADLLYVLASNRFVAREELERIFKALTDKIVEPTEFIYSHNEDDRLVQAVIGGVQRRLMEEFFYKDWLKSFIFDNGVKRPWKKSFEKEEANNAYFNTRNFLRSLYLRVLQTEKLASRDFLMKEILATLQALEQF